MSISRFELDPKFRLHGRPRSASISRALLEKVDLSERVTRVLSAFGRDPAERRGRSHVGALLTEWASRVVEWNLRIDLTAARSHDELIDLLLADAAAISAAVGAAHGVSWVDVGSGAGAPGVALAVLCPDLALTLVEPKAKRVSFLRSVVGALELERVRVERARSDQLAGERFDVAVSRATLKPADWLEEGSRLARDSVWLLLGRAEAPALAGFEKTNDLEYLWPLTQVERRAVEYRRGAALVKREQLC